METSVLSPPNGQSRNTADHEKQNHKFHRKSHGHEPMDNGISNEQQLVPYDTSENYSSQINPQYYINPNQMPYNPIAHQFLLVRLTPQYAYPQMPTMPMNLPPSLVELPMIPTDIDQQQQQQLSIDLTNPPSSSMIDSTVPSSSISSNVDHENTDDAPADSTDSSVQMKDNKNTDGIREEPTFNSDASSKMKRERNDKSGAPKSNNRTETNYPVVTRVFYSNTRSKNSYSENNQHRRRDVYPPRYFQNQPIDIDCSITQSWTDENGQMFVFSSASLTTATSPFRFGPFTVNFGEIVDGALVIDQFVKHGLQNYQFKLEIVAYRTLTVEENKTRILIYVDDYESFTFLSNLNNWPMTLSKCNFETIKPPTPSPLCLILTAVPADIHWKTFVQAVQDRYPDIFDVTCLNNKPSTSVRIVKLEFKTTTSRDKVYRDGFISIMHMKLKVYENSPKAKVLICTNCFYVGHFRKDCPQKNASTCEYCREIYPSSAYHSCSSVLQCLHCGGPHRSIDFTCPALRAFKISFTNFLRSKIIPSDIDFTNRSPSSSADNRYFNHSSNSEPYCTVAQMMPFDPNEEVSEKLSNVLAKAKKDAAPTGAAFYRLRNEMRSRYEETNQKVEKLEKTMELMEKKFDDLSKLLNQ